MLKMSKSFVIRMVLWSVLMLYLICDFFLFTGPLKQELNRMYPTPADKLADAVAEGICARVYNRPIYLTQVDRRISENLWRQGRDAGKVRENEMQGLRWVALNELIDSYLMRVKTRANEREVPVSEGEVDAEVARFEKRFPSPDELDKAMAAQGIEGRKELRYRLAARLQQEKYVLKRIQPTLEVSDEEARQWYDTHRKELTMPARRRARHVFLASLDHPSDEAEASLAGHLASLKEGETTWEKLATEVSEDSRSKKIAGDLGWMSRKRLPGDFAAVVFSIPPHTPTLMRSKLGWHILEVTGVKSPELLPYATMKKEVLAALKDVRRKDAIKQYRHQLRLINRKKVEIYPEVLK